ncbi:beta-N-acetylhexosaminidase [Candidatus Marinamargulisbacteria bacterium SCGC AG-333-B06]|nr:beta-N-acetylhexosaminidase [Candidatus Marinamargulisbacteria bacterium SCGC AG-333-B06]
MMFKRNEVCYKKEMKHLWIIIGIIIMGSVTLATSNHSLIGQHMIIGISHYPIQKEWLTFIKENKISGIIFISDTYKQADKIKRSIETIKQVTTHTLFFCIDQEGGQVSRIKDNIIQVPAASKIAALYSEQEAFITYQKQARELANLGINVNFSPVLDIINNKNNTVIGSRSFGSTPKIVFKFGKEVINASLMENIIPVMKHFPGHGYTTHDSHKQMPIHTNKDHLFNVDIIPFKKGIQIGAPAIMVSHVLYPELDANNPASLSEVIITTYLKKTLKFNGIVFSDDLTMGAITNQYKLAVAFKKSIKAGVHQAIIITPLNSLKSFMKDIEKELNQDKSLIKIMKHNKQIINRFK